MGFTGLINFRDAGGYPTRDGGRMRRGVVFRSGRFEVARSVDIATIEGLGIRTVIDLRTEAERERAGRAELYMARPELREQHLPYISRLGEKRSTHTDESHWHPAELARRYLKGTIGQGRYTLARLIDLLARPETPPLIVHCWSGKDRTGQAVATVQALIGVADEDIAADYAASGAWFTEHLPLFPDLQAAVSPAAYKVRPETMELWLEGVRAQFGSVEQMLLESGSTPAAIETVRETYTE